MGGWSWDWLGARVDGLEHGEVGEGVVDVDRSVVVDRLNEGFELGTAGAEGSAALDLAALTNEQDP